MIYTMTSAEGHRRYTMIGTADEVENCLSILLEKYPEGRFKTIVERHNIVEGYRVIRVWRIERPGADGAPVCSI